MQRSRLNGQVRRKACVHILVRVLNTFLLEQYAYKEGGRVIRAQPDHIVIDGVSCWGDTALYFADRVGPKGKVYCFEFNPDNLKIFEKNVLLNQRTADRLTIGRALYEINLG